LFAFNSRSKGREFLFAWRELNAIQRRHWAMSHCIRVFATLLVCQHIFAAEVVKLKRDQNFFPLSVWLQSPRNAERFKAAGINAYVGLWHGPDEEQFNQLKAAGLKLVCEQNQFALAHKDDPTIIAWMQGDEPDNAQSLGNGKGYGPPILPEKVIARYEQIHAKDPTRPVMLNLGQAVAWDNYIGRGVRRNHPEDYAEYVKGGDIVSFDIYPVTHPEAAVKGKLEYVGNGVQRLKKWAGPDREVWNCVEAKVAEDGSHISPEQFRAEVWMSIANGTRGIIYFVHQFKPSFREASVFDDPDLLKAMTQVNKEIAELAPVLNSDDSPRVSINAKPENSSVAALAKRKGNAIYLFAVGMSAAPSSASFAIEGLNGDYNVNALHESRNFHTANGQINDAFGSYGVHLYKITPAQR
jgi:hypothetical protein